MKILTVIVQLCSIAIIATSSSIPIEKCLTSINIQFENESSESKQPPLEIDPGEALILSEYLEKNDTETARMLSRVDTNRWFLNIVSHSGYITVDKRYNSNLYFWYFPVKDRVVEESPFIIWLQGGPGTPFFYGLFEELGPYKYKKNSTNIEENPYSWHKENSLLFIDNPVGTGYSFTDVDEGYAQNQTIVSFTVYYWGEFKCAFIIAEHLYIFLMQFLRIFPELQDVPLYIIGESFAGKHVPSFAHFIHEMNPSSDIKVNLKGLAIGNGFIDPESEMGRSAYLYQLGLIDDTQMENLKLYESRMKVLLLEENYEDAFHQNIDLVTFILEYSKLKDCYNYMSETNTNIINPYNELVQQCIIRKALHIGCKEFTPFGGKVSDYLVGDFMKSIQPDLEELLEHYRVMLYSGQFDMLEPYPLSVKVYRSFNWSGKDEYLKAKRKRWYVNGTVIGYTKKAGNLFEVFLRNAGHMVPKDQPERAKLLVDSFIRDLSFYDGNYDWENWNDSTIIDENYEKALNDMVVTESKLSEDSEDTFNNSSSSRENSEDALILSDYLENNDTDTARILSTVDLKQWSIDIVSHSGYITVDKNYNSNLYFWYFPVKDQIVENSPLIIWMQGGPGQSSMLGLFEELGPFSVNENSDSLIENPHSWHKENSVLFIDNPVGTGYSFTDSEEGYARNQTIIAEHLYIFLMQFLRIFSELQGVPLYIAGESYAGKHVSSLAHLIHKMNPTADIKVNLKGLAIGNGYLDPLSEMDRGPYLYQLGLIDDNQMMELSYFDKDLKLALERMDYANATLSNTEILKNFILMSGLKNYYNYVTETSIDFNGHFVTFVRQCNVRKALHVGNTEFKLLSGKLVSYLEEDLIKGVKAELEELLEHYRVMFYSGQLDIILPYPLAVKLYRNLTWSGKDDYLNAERKPWFVNNTVIGYTKKAGNLFEVCMRNAGHQVGKDVPERAYLLINSFIKYLPFEDRPDVNSYEDSQFSTMSHNDSELLSHLLSVNTFFEDLNDSTIKWQFSGGSKTFPNLIFFIFINSALLLAVYGL